MSYISDLPPEEELRELHEHLVSWVRSKENHLKVYEETVMIRDRKLDARERMLNEKEKILKNIEVKLTGNSS